MAFTTTKSGRSLLLLGIALTAVLAVTFSLFSREQQTARAVAEKATITATSPSKAGLVLASEHLGPLRIDSDFKLDLDRLRQIFAGYSVNQGIGEQDGPDFVYYVVSDADGELFMIKADDDDPERIGEIIVRRARIVDEYGLRIGSTYQDILKARPNVISEAGDHFRTYVGHAQENIAYELVASYSDGYDGPDRALTAQEIASGKVLKLLWLNRNPRPESVDECDFDQETQLAENIALAKAYPGSHLVEGARKLIIPTAEGEIRIRIGGCVHYGVTVELKTKDVSKYERDDAFMEKILLLASEYGQGYVDEKKLERVIKEGRWSRSQSTVRHYTLDYDTTSTFEAYVQDDKGYKVIGFSSHN